MRVIRPFPVVKDGVLRRQVGRIGSEPRVEVRRPDRNDAAVVTGCGDFRRRIIGKRAEMDVWNCLT
jgi:hypothetical protein